MASTRDLSSPLTSVSFVCGSCRHKFASDPARVEDAPERHHPYLYFADCPSCGEEAEQAPWEKALMASYGKHTGPKTQDGKKAVSLNLDGHPTPEETLRTRFNAMKHGLRSRVATYYPAKPGSYPQCKTCDIDWYECSQNVACMKKTELFMRHQIAFDSRDPTLLTDIRSDFHAGVQAILTDILQTIIGDGVTVARPAYTVKDGEIKVGEFVDDKGERHIVYDEISAHPLLKILSEFISRNNLSLGDMGMTPKVSEANEVVMGNLAEEKEDRQKLLDYQEQQTNQLSQLKDLISKSQNRLNKDPVLIEHNDG